MIKWSDDLLIGHPVIDRDHRRLVEIINLFYARAAQDQDVLNIHATLMDLFAYSKDHFMREQSIQRACDYPQCDEHEEEHRVILSQIKDMISVYFIKKSSPVDTMAMKHMSDFLSRWLLDHIYNFDYTMKEWVGKESTD